MVLINETKYACQSCIKGHRSSSCTHTDRPLFEIKKKGRPATQCSHCRELRKTKQVHVKCMCEAPPAPPPPPSAPPVASTSSTSNVGRDEPFSGGESSSSAAAAPPSQPKPKTKTKKKDVTLNPPIFPNGLKDYHEMAIAAEALSGLLGGPAVVVKNEKSSVDSLLNPCMCRAGGGCACCTDKKKSSKKSDGPSPSSSAGAGGCCSSKSKPPNPVAPPLPPSRSTSTYSAYSSTNNSTENLADPSFQLKNPLPVSLRNYQPTSNAGSGTSTPPTSRPLPSDELSHIHPAHTSRHVHKTQLYNPYRGGSNGHLPQGNLQPSRSASQSRRSSSATNAPPQQLAPMKSLTEQMCTFVRVQEQSLLRSNASGSGDELEGVVASGDGGGANVMLPPFETFLRGGKDGEGGMMSGCMCGDGCACPNCVQHGNMEVDEEGGEVREHKDCPPSCSSCFNCTSGFSLPKNVSNIEDLIAACASELPPPPVARQQNSYALDATNVNVLPQSAWASKESKEAFGLLEVPKLECCSGRCQCPPGDCSCMKDCCGCCGGCDCEGEGDASKAEPQADQPLDWTLPPQETSSNEDADGEEPSIPSSCCSGKPPVADAPPPNPSPPPPSNSIARAPAPPLASSSTAIQPQKPSIYKKPAKSDHHRPIGSYEQQPIIKSLSRSNSTASKPHRPQLSKSVSQGVFGNGESLSPTSNASPIEFQGGSFRRDRSGSSASRSSYQPSPNRSGAATPVSQVSSPHLRPQNHSSDFASLREDNLRQSAFYPPPLQQPSSSSSSVHHANEELFQLQHNPNLNSLVSNSTLPDSHDQFRSYEEFVAASHLHQHTLMQEQQRLQEEREQQEQDRQQQQQHQQQQQQQQQQGHASQALEMFLLDEEMEAQLNALLAGSTDASNTSSVTDFSLGLEDPSANLSSSLHLQDQSSQQQHQYQPQQHHQQQQHQSNEDFIQAFQPNFDFDPPSPRRGQREFSPMQFDEATGTFGADFGVGQDLGGPYDGGANFPANAADFLLSNFAAPTPAAQEVEESHHHVDEAQKGGPPENVVSPDPFGGLEFDPDSFLQDALGLDASNDPHLQDGSSGSSSGDTNGGGTLVDPLFDTTSFDTGDFDFNSFTKNSLSNWDQTSI